MADNMASEAVSHDPRHNRKKALEALEVAKRIERDRLASGKYEWVIEGKTRVLKRKKKSSKNKVK